MFRLCMWSHVFSDEEMYKVRRTVQTRKLPKIMIPDISRRFKRQFIVKKIGDVKKGTNKLYCTIDTRKAIKENMIELLNYFYWKTIIWFGGYYQSINFT